jgi:hypothetical protein
MNKFIFLTICILSFGLQLHAEEVDTLNSRSIFLDEVVVQSFKQNKSYRLELEAKTGKRVISPLNAKSGILLKGKPEDISKEGSEDELKD